MRLWLSVTVQLIARKDSALKRTINLLVERNIKLDSLTPIQFLHVRKINVAKNYSKLQKKTFAVGIRGKTVGLV